MFLYIVRHGDPDYSTDSLVPRGVLQAEAVAKRLCEVGVDRIFTSPMGRARQTAEPLCKLLGKEYEVEEWTHEISVRTSFPEGEERAIAMVPNIYFRQDNCWDLRVSETAQCPVFDGTNMVEMAERIEKEGNEFLEKLGYRYEDGNYRILRPNEEKIALFCHGNFARVWLSSLLKVPMHMMLASFGYTHTGVTVLQFKNNENGITAPRCLLYSDMSHLYAHGPDLDYNGYCLV